MPAGRPCEYTKEVGDKICEGLMNGLSLRRVCQADDLPDISTVLRWLRVLPEFSQQYALARNVQYERLADELFDIADDGTNDWITIEKESGDYEVPNHEHINRSRLRIDTRKWFLSKVLPKKYGEKVEIEQRSSLTVLNAERLKNLSTEELQALESITAKLTASVGDPSGTPETEAE